MNIPLPIPVALGGTGQVTAFGTGVATALTVNVGSAGAPVLFNGAGGTPTSLTLTNATGLPIAGIASLGTGVATLLGQTSSGTAGLVGTTSPTLITPTLGVASATSINKVALTAPATGSTLTILDGKTLTVNNTIVLAGTDAQTYTFPSTSATIARTDALQTFTGVQTFSSGPSFGALPTGAGVASAGTASTLASRDANKNLTANAFLSAFTSTATATGTTTMTIASTPIQIWTGTLAQTVKLPTTSVAAGQQFLIINQSTLAVTVQSSGANQIAILAAGTSGMFTAAIATPTTAANWIGQYFGDIITAGKSLSVSNTLTLAGTDATTMTFPSTSATIARTDAANTFTGVQTMTSPALTTPAITGLATGSGVATAATASTLVARDANGNTVVTNLQQGYTTTATATGTTTLTIASNNNQVFTGTLAQTVVLPVVATLTLGTDYVITNQSTLAVTVQSSGPNTIVILQPGQVGTFTSNATSGTGAAVWNFVVQNATYNTRNNDGSNVVEANSFVETGYVHNVIGANAHASSAITFGHTYATAPIVVAVYGGDATSATTYGSGSNIVKGPVACKATDVTTTGCNIWWHSSDGTSWSAGNVVFAQFIVIGI